MAPISAKIDVLIWPISFEKSPGFVNNYSFFVLK